jgi:hypothetical protein
MRKEARFALFLVAILAAATLSAAELFPVYQSYQKAVAQDDAGAAKSHLAEERREVIARMGNSEALAAMNVLSPKKKLRMHKEIFDGDDATLIVTANVSDNDSTGRIQFVREGSSWKILSELWDLGGSPDDPWPNEVRQPKTDSERKALRALRAKGYPMPTADFLVMTAGQGDAEAVKLFLAAGYSPDTNDRGTPAIVSAASSSHAEVVQLLIDAGADVNAVDEINTTALMRAASTCEATPTIRALLKAGARTDIKSRGDSTALQLAQYSSCAENAAAIEAAKPKKK